MQVQDARNKDLSTDFRVGDHVHWGWNGDYYPGVVVKVMPSYIEVDDLELSITMKTREYMRSLPGATLIEGEHEVMFVPYTGDVIEPRRFTRRKDGVYRMQGRKVNTLHHYAMWGRNPSF